MDFKTWVAEFERKNGRRPSGYVAGPMTLYKDRPTNDPTRWGRCFFERASVYFRAQSIDVFSPIEQDDQEGGPDEVFKKYTWEQVLAKDLIILKKMDFIALLPEWNKSDGATLEAAEGQRRGKPLFRVLFSDTTNGYVVTGMSEQFPLVPIVHNMEEPSLMKAKPVGPPTSGTEVRMVSSTGGQKGSKLARFDLVPPIPLWELAEHYGKGCAKYAARNWERGYPWSLTYAAMMRHAVLIWQGEDIDPETGAYHEIAVAWHAFALRQFRNDHPEFDDRPSTLLRAGKAPVHEANQRG